MASMTCKTHKLSGHSRPAPTTSLRFGVYRFRGLRFRGLRFRGVGVRALEFRVYSSVQGLTF